MSLGKMQESKKKKKISDGTNEQNIKNLVVVIKTRTIITFFFGKIAAMVEVAFARKNEK